MTAEAALKQIDRLSIWDISHYWHDVNPLTSSPSRLPLEVQKTIRALSQKAIKSLYLRCSGKGIIYKTLTGPDKHVPLSYVRRAYRREFKYAIEGRKYKRKFLGNINMSRAGVLVWCKENGIKPPAFWFAPDDPILGKSAEDLVRKLTPDEIELYGLVVLFDDEPRSAKGPMRMSSDVDLSEDRPGFKAESSIIKDALSQMNKAIAKSRFAPAQELKLKYKDFYQAKGYKNKSKAARDFFDSLTPEQRKILVPTYYERAETDFYSQATRNLLKVFKT